MQRNIATQCIFLPFFCTKKVRALLRLPERTSHLPPQPVQPGRSGVSVRFAAGPDPLKVELLIHGSRCKKLSGRKEKERKTPS